MSELQPGANTALPPAGEYVVQLSTHHAHADLIVLCVRADGTADGDNGVALWSQPSCAGGAVLIDTSTDSVRVRVGRLAADVQRLLIVAQADGIADLSQAGALTAQVWADATPAASLTIATPPPLPTVQVAELYRHASGFKVRCLGDGYAQGLQRLLEVHGIQVDEPAPVTQAVPFVPPAPLASVAQPVATPQPAPATPPAPASPIDLEKRRRIDIVKRVQATGSLSLTKKVEAAAVSLDKSGLNGQRAQVVLVLDVSGSARPLFKDGRYQMLVERALAAGLLFDDDGTIESYLFDSGLHEAPDITLDNFQTWTQDILKRRDIWGGTTYAPPIEHIARQVGRGRSVPTYVIFVTDGGNSDRRRAANAMKDAAHAGVFWQFMAVGRESDFPFLQKLDDLSGREVDNADFFAFESPAQVPDDLFFARMMGEFPGWIKAARERGILQG